MVQCLERAFKNDQALRNYLGHFREPKSVTQNWNSGTCASRCIYCASNLKNMYAFSFNVHDCFPSHWLVLTPACLGMISYVQLD